MMKSPTRTDDPEEQLRRGHLSHQWIHKAILLIVAGLCLAACNLTQKLPISQADGRAQAQGLDVTAALTDGALDGTPDSYIPPYTPLPSLTPTRTLLPPPTFEPPTLTPFPTYTLQPTATPTVDLGVSLEGLHGLETPTATPTIVCAPRDDWGQTYTIQPGDYLFNIAQRYGTTVDAIASANCLHNINILSVGIVLKVPGAAGGQGIACTPWELLTPRDGTFEVGGSGMLTFNWRGPRAPRNLIRVHKPDGGTYERVIELRQNETIDLADLPLAGTYTWYVYPLDEGFRQIACHEGGPWTFTKPAAPTATPAPALP